MASTGEQKCIDINGIEMCTRPPSADISPDSACVNISGETFCPLDRKHLTMRDEIDDFKKSVFYPKLRMDEARNMKKILIETTIGFMISSLVFVLSLYIKDILDYIMAIVFPVDGSFISLVIIAVVLACLMISMSFMEYRIARSLYKTRIVEKFAEKNPVEILNILMDHEPIEK